MQVPHVRRPFRMILFLATSCFTLGKLIQKRPRTVGKREESDANERTGVKICFPFSSCLPPLHSAMKLFRIRSRNIFTHTPRCRATSRYLVMKTQSAPFIRCVQNWLCLCPNAVKGQQRFYHIWPRQNCCPFSLNSCKLWQLCGGCKNETRERSRFKRLSLEFVIGLHTRNRQQPTTTISIASSCSPLCVAFVNYFNSITNGCCQKLPAGKTMH